MQTQWLDCVYITLRTDHNASSTISGAGHAEWLTFQSEVCLHLSFQCVRGQFPDTGLMLMPSVNAASERFIQVTKQSKAKQSKAKQSKAEQSKAEQSKAKQNKTKQNKTKQKTNH